MLPACVEDYVGPDALVRVVDAFIDSLELGDLGFARSVAAATGRPGYSPGDMLRLYIWGYLNQVCSSRHLEKACVRDLEALWLMRRLAPDYCTIAAFRHDNPEAIIVASAAFIQFCREQGLIGGRMVALDGTKMPAVASPKTIAGAERLARDTAHTEKEIAYYLDRLDIIDNTVAQGFDDQPLHRQGSRRPSPLCNAGRTGSCTASRNWSNVTKRFSSSASRRQSRWGMALHPRHRRTTSRAQSTSIAD